MSQSGVDLAWPFAGRIVHALGDELLERPWLCLRTRSGLEFTPVPDLVLRGLTTIERWLTMPDAARDLLEPYRVGEAQRPAEPAAPRRLLGVGTPHRLSARPGTLLSDFLLLMTPTAHALRDQNDRRTIRGTLGADWLTHLYRVLHSQLYRSEITLTGLRWPLSPTPVVQSITAEELPGWLLDPATDFARLIGTETYLCDLRVVPATAAAAPTETSDPPAPPNNRMKQPPRDTVARVIR